MIYHRIRNAAQNVNTVQSCNQQSSATIWRKPVTVELRKMLEETIGKESAEEEMQKAMQLSRMSEEERDKYLEKEIEREIERKAEQIVEGIRKIMADRK